MRLNCFQKQEKRLLSKQKNAGNWLNCKGSNLRKKKPGNANKELKRRGRENLRPSSREKEKLRPKGKDRDWLSSNLADS